MNNLSSFGVQELNAKQVKETQGGFSYSCAIAAMAAFSFLVGFTEGVGEGISEHGAEQYF